MTERREGEAEAAEQKFSEVGAYSSSNMSAAA